MFQQMWFGDIDSHMLFLVSVYLISLNASHLPLSLNLTRSTNHCHYIQMCDKSTEETWINECSKTMQMLPYRAWRVTELMKMMETICNGFHSHHYSILSTTISKTPNEEIYLGRMVFIPPVQLQRGSGGLWCSNILLRCFRQVFPLISRGQRGLKFPQLLRYTWESSAVWLFTELQWIMLWCQCCYFSKACPCCLCFSITLTDFKHSISPHVA